MGKNIEKRKKDVERLAVTRGVELQDLPEQERVRTYGLVLLEMDTLIG
jgi:hypothetical protein